MFEGMRINFSDLTLITLTLFRIPFVFQVLQWTPILAWTLAYLYMVIAMVMISPLDLLFHLVVTQDTGWAMKSPFYVRKTTGGVIHFQHVMVRIHSICKINWFINQKKNQHNLVKCEAKHKYKYFICLKEYLEVCQFYVIKPLIKKQKNEYW